MRKWMILLAAVLMLLAGCGKEPAVAGLSNEEFHRYFAEDYARPMSSITEITEENGGLMLKTDLGAPITAMKDGTVAWAADVGWKDRRHREAGRQDRRGRRYRAYRGWHPGGGVPLPTGGCGAGDRRRWDGERIYRER